MTTPNRPTLETERLILRPFELSDAETVRTLAGAREIAETTLNIPHPYPEGGAEAWFKAGYEAMEKGTGFPLAVVRKEDGDLVGCMAINVVPQDKRAELAYWFGLPYWGKGYATEAARAMLHFGFTQLDLNVIFAAYMTINPASARVMQKLGMTYEGTRRQLYIKWGKAHDIGYYSILRSEYQG